MLVAIKGKINKVYFISRPTWEEVLPCLKCISYKKTKYCKKKEAFKFLNQGEGIIQRDEQLIIDLIKAGIKELPQDENKQQNMPKQKTSKKKKEKAKNKTPPEQKPQKEKKKQKENTKEEKKKEKVKDCEYEIAHASAKIFGNVRILREIDPCDAKLSGSYRKHFLRYLRAGGNEIQHGEFKGQVTVVIDKQQKILIHPVICQFEDKDHKKIKEKEDHVWIYDAEEFFKMGIEKKSFVSFSALAYTYKRTNGSIDLGLKMPVNIKTIESLA